MDKVNPNRTHLQAPLTTGLSFSGNFSQPAIRGAGRCAPGAPGEPPAMLRQPKSPRGASTIPKIGPASPSNGGADAPRISRWGLGTPICHPKGRRPGNLPPPPNPVGARRNTFPKNLQPAIRKAGRCAPGTPGEPPAMLRQPKSPRGASTIPKIGPAAPSGGGRCSANVALTARRLDTLTA